METLRDRLIGNGWSEESASLVAIVAAILLSMLIGWVLRALADAPLKRVAPTGPWYEALVRYRVLSRVGWLIMTIAAKWLVLPLFEPWPKLAERAETLTDALLVIAVTGALSRLIAASVDVRRKGESEVRLPFKFLGQALQVVLWTYASVATLSILTDRDVASVLTGLTAVGAILVYIFRDPILGWTAGVQIAANDLLREGDWISVPRYDADGVVEEISLTTVKVRNFDETVSSLPTYSLYSEGFRNWRGMYESGGRRIRRTFAVDVNSVRVCDDALLERLARNAFVQEFLDARREHHAAPNDVLSDERPTNLECFRAWLEGWLDAHPELNHDLISMVRELEPEGRGIPVEIYTFSAVQEWEAYEKLQADITDHVFAVLAEFDLRAFQELASADVGTLAAARATSK